MRILAADTSTASGSIALLEDSTIIAEWTLHSAITHNRRLLKSMDSLLRDVSWSIDHVDAFCVTCGPGSFTGIRIGLTTVKTLAWSLHKPLSSVTSLDALAFPLCSCPSPVCALIDARKKEVYYGLYRPGGNGTLELLEPYGVASPHEVAQRIESLKEATWFCGDGWLLYRDIFRGSLGESAIEAPGPFHLIRAGFVGELGRRKILAAQADDPAAAMPLYIRPSEAELNNPRLADAHAKGGSTPEPSQS